MRGITIDREKLVRVGREADVIMGAGVRIDPFSECE